MASLASTSNGFIAQTYGDLLWTNNSNGGLPSTLTAIYDGLGNAAPLKLSTTQVGVDNLLFDGNTITTGSGALTLNSFTTVCNLATSSGSTLTIGNSTGTTQINGTVSFGGSITYTNLTLTGTLTTAGLILDGDTIATSGAVTLAGVVTTAGAFITSGANSLTLTTTASTNVTLPTTGTLSTLAGSETFTNKTLTSPIISTISNTGTLTLPTSTDTLVGKATTDTLTNKTLTTPTITTAVLNGAITGTSLAAASDQETGTSTSLLVTPGVQSRHPSACKFHVNFAGATGAIGTSYNVASVVRNSTGNYTITFTTAFSSAAFTVVGSCLQAGAAVIVIASRATTYVIVNAIVTTTGAQQDVSDVELIGFGDQ